MIDKPKFANQVFGGRGGSLWSTSVLTADLRVALTDANLLAGLATSVKRGDRIFIGAYLTDQDFADEVRDAVAQLLVTDVGKSMTAPDGQKRPGKVGFRILDMFVLGPTPAKIIEDRGAVEAVAS